MRPGAEAGVERVAVTGKHGGSEAALRRVRRLFVNRADMRAALRKPVNAAFAARDEMRWGTGAACACLTAASSAPGPAT